MRVHVRVRTEGLEALSSAGVKRAIRNWVRLGGPIVQRTMVQVIRRKQQTFGRTGHLANSVRVLERGAHGFSVGPEAEYAPHVQWPTRPHEIRPRHKKALAFAPSAGMLGLQNVPGLEAQTRRGITRKGRVFGVVRQGGKQRRTRAVIVRSVRHPGTSGMFFLEATAEAVEPTLTYYLNQELQRELDGQGGGGS